MISWPAGPETEAFVLQQTEQLPAANWSQAPATPVVVGNDCGSGETIAKVTGGRVVPVGDAPALARALGEILDAQARWRGVACQAQPAVRTGFGSASVAARLDDVYFEVVSA